MKKIKSQDLQNETFEEAAGRLGHLRPHKRKPSYLDWLKKVVLIFIDSLDLVVVRKAMRAMRPRAVYLVGIVC